MSIETLAREFVAATKKRAQARAHLSKLRKKWHEETGSYFDRHGSEGEDGHTEMMEALHDRETCNAELRRAKSRLFRAVGVGVPVGSPQQSRGGSSDGA